MAIEFHIAPQVLLDPDLPEDIFSTMVDVFWKRVELRK
jgi:hypothetical protein